MRWLGILLLVTWLLLPAPALAKDLDAGAVSGGAVSGNLTLTRISGHEVGITWEMPDTANKTMVRACYSRYPATREDGYLVYYGEGTSASDNTVNFEALLTSIHYRAWSANATGDWLPLYLEGEIGGISVTFIAFIVLAVGLMIACYAFKKMVLGFGAAGGWLLLGFYSYTIYLEEGVFYWWVAFFAWGMVIVSTFEAMGARGKKEVGDDWEADDKSEEEEDADAVIADAEASRSITDRLRKLYHRPRRVKRHKGRGKR